MQQELSGWTLSDMQLYVRGQNSRFPLSEDGLLDILERLMSLQKNQKGFPQGRRYVEPCDNDTKIKKMFDLVLAIGNSPKLSAATFERMGAFMQAYDDLIVAYDRAHKQIYGERLKKQLRLSAALLEKKSQLQHRLDLLHPLRNDT